MDTDAFSRALGNVVASGRCSGCGACAMLDSAISMELDQHGFMRPHRRPAAAGSVLREARDLETLASAFATVCPGVGVTAPPALGAAVHPIFGRYVSVWQAHATDDGVRKAGSSGGVITALAAWLVESGQASGAVCAAGAPTGTASVSVTISSREEIERSAGSRYAPVPSAANYRPDLQDQLFVGKPCEVSAAAAIDGLAGIGLDGPVKLSFFCAGTPSQFATDELVSGGGLKPDAVASVRYRGDGWPGDFVSSEHRGSATLEVRRSYDDAWGNHLGKQVDARCRVCVDATGEWADIAVGDFWDTDSAGYPVFSSENPGVSLVICRTARGHRILLDAERQGVVAATPLDIELIMPVQPLQVTRRRTVQGRLVGLRLAGHHVPRYRGYHLWRLALGNPISSLRYAWGTWRRAVRKKKPPSASH